MHSSSSKREKMVEMKMTFSEKENPEDTQWINNIENLHIPRSDMNRLIMNYLVTEGFKEAAEKFQIEAGINPSVELNSLDNRIRIRDAIQNGQVQEAISLINTLYPELLDDNPYLLFHIQQQHLIELIREGKVEEALQFAQENLSERGEDNPKVAEELERTLALLAFENPEQSPFWDLLHPSYRQKVASEVNTAILKQEDQQESFSKLSVVLKMLLWAQSELDKVKVKYPKMANLITAKLESSAK